MPLEDEFVICINEDVCRPEQLVSAIIGCLFFAATTVADRVESEEFGARVLGDAFKTIASIVTPELATTEASSVRGVNVSVFPFPLMSEDYRITLNMYDGSDGDVIQKLTSAYGDKILKGELKLHYVHGFVVEPSEIEIAVFINCDSAKDFLMQQAIIAHELFHAVAKVIRTFDDSTELGARIYRVLFDQFVSCLTEN